MDGLTRFARYLVSSLLVVWLVRWVRRVLPEKQRTWRHFWT